MDIKEFLMTHKSINEIYNDLTMEEICNIFDIFLSTCLNANGTCDSCPLDNNSICCFALRDIAMKKVIDIHNSHIALSDHKEIE